jgi:hypothetical protein
MILISVFSGSEAKPYISDRMGDAVLTLNLGVDNEEQGMKAEKVQSRIFESLKLGESCFIDRGAWLGLTSCLKQAGLLRNKLNCLMPEDMFREWIGVQCRKKNQAVSPLAKFCETSWDFKVNDQYRTGIQAVPRCLDTRSSNSAQPDWRIATRSSRQHSDLVD